MKVALLDDFHDLIPSTLLSWGWETVDARKWNAQDFKNNSNLSLYLYIINNANNIQDILRTIDFIGLKLFIIIILLYYYIIFSLNLSLIIFDYYL